VNSTIAAVATAASGEFDGSKTITTTPGVPPTTVLINAVARADACGGNRSPGSLRSETARRLGLPDSPVEIPEEAMLVRDEQRCGVEAMCRYI